MTVVSRSGLSSFLDILILYMTVASSSRLWSEDDEDEDDEDEDDAEDDEDSDSDSDESREVIGSRMDGREDMMSWLYLTINHE